MKDSFILYLEQQEVFEMLTDEEAGKLIKAIFEYEKTGQVVNLDKSLQIAFIPIRSALDRNKEKYDKVVERNRENGKKGGRPKNLVGCLGNEEKPKKADNDNVHERDNEHDNECDSVHDRDNNAPVSQKKQESKIHFAEFVSMTNAEYEKLVSTYGKDSADQCIVVLDNYKGANGKKYKSDYRAILNWVIKRVEEDNKRIRPNLKNYDYEGDDTL